MSKTETYLVVGFTQSAKNLIQQLQKRPKLQIIWIGEGSAPADTSNVTVSSVRNPSFPETLSNQIDKHSPDMVFLSSNAENDLLSLQGGQTLQDVILQEDLKIDRIPIIVISEMHYE
ncbi:MAG: hypothetical protein ABEK50_03160 [bacterium]